MTIPRAHPFHFDPTYGATLPALESIRPPAAPDGFDAFWNARYAKAINADPKPSLSRSELQHANWNVLDISYASTDGVAIGGWLLLPKRSAIKRGLVVGHGYGGRDQPEFDVPVEETAVLFFCARGMSRSAHPPIPSEASGHVLHGIESRDSYVIGGCVEDIWLAVSALIELYPWLEGRIGYSGVSFGGGLGALAIPFDTRIDRGFLAIPTFGNRPLWLRLPTVGSADSVQQYQRKHGSVLETLRFFDAATAATRITVPMLVAAARFDPAVAPPCQFSVANALPGSKEIFVLDAGHFDYDGAAEQNEELRAKVALFFTAGAEPHSNAQSAAPASPDRDRPSVPD